MPPGKIVIAFDLYGTLLSTESIAEELAKHFGQEKAQTIAASWRRYQLEYTWRINSMGAYRSFSEITRSSLSHALAEQGQRLSKTHTDRLIEAYDSLHVFPEVPAALELVKDKSHLLDAHIFSNGTVDMVGNSVNSSPDLGPHKDLFKSLITVDKLKCYKPDMRVYDHLVKTAGKEGQKSEVWVVSANPFDIVGAKAAGLKAAFVDRLGKGWIDRLDELQVPSIIAVGVEDAVKSIIGWTEDSKLHEAKSKGDES